MLTIRFIICDDHRLEKTLTHSQFIDRSEDDSDEEDQIIETDEELRKLTKCKMCSKFKYRSLV